MMRTAFKVVLALLALYAAYLIYMRYFYYRMMYSGGSTWPYPLWGPMDPSLWCGSSYEGFGCTPKQVQAAQNVPRAVQIASVQQYLNANTERPC